MPQKTRKNASETSKKESGKILDIRKNTPEKLGKILPKKRDSGGNHFFHLWLHVACTAFNALQIYIINIRVHQNSKKFSKSHGLLIYFVPTCIQAISAKKMIFFAFSQLGRHFEKNGPCSWENEVKICKIQNLFISHPPFWGDVGVKKWSPFLDSAARSPIFGHLKIGTFGNGDVAVI